MRTQAFLAATALVVVLLAVGVLSASANPLLPLGPLDVGDTYTLAYAAGAHGSISGESPQTVASGASGSPVEAVPDTGYHFVQWSDDRTDNPRTDTNVQGNVDVTATFAIDTFSLTYAAGAHGSITGDTSQSVAYGADGTAVTAVADANYHFVKWSDNSTENPRTDTNVTENISVTASFAIDNFSLTYAAAGSHGSLTGDVSQSVAYGGNGTAVTAVADANYHFVKWSDNSTENPRTDTNVTENISVTASFAIDNFSLTYAAAGSHGSLTGDVSQSVAYGGNGTAVTAVADANYHFVKWSDNSTENPRTDTNVTENISVTASFAIDNFSLTYAAAGSHGSLTGDVSQSVAYGGNGTAVTAVADANYHFVKWSDNSTENPRTDTNVTENISVTASFAIDNFSLTYAAAGSHGSLTGDVSQSVAYGGNGTAVTAVADANYHFVKWSDNSTENPRTDTNVTENISVTASFAIDNFSLTYAATGSHGSLTGDVSQSVAYGGNGTAVTAVADANYHFVKWSDNSTENPRTDTNVTENISVTASFAIDTFTLTYTAGAHGTITGTSPQTVAYGANGTAVTAVPATGYHFVKWSDNKTANPRTDTNVAADVDVTASFAIDTFTLTYTAGAHGTITGTSPQTVAYGANGTAVTAVPATGYHFVKWSDNKTANPRTDTNVAADVDVSASFAIDTFSLTYAAGAHGSITGDTSQSVAYGADGTAVTAVPATGYHFVQWSDGKTANPRTDSNVKADLSVTASFAIDTFSLTYAAAGSHGSITGDASQSVAYGGNGTAVTAVPATGYHFVKWSDNSTENPRTDTNVTADISVSASFAIDTFSLTYAAGAHGTITGTSPQTVAYGADGTAVTAVPATGYHFVKWSDNSTENPRTDTNVTANISVSASFAINTYTLTYTAGTHGTIQGTSPQTVTYGANGTAITAVPDTGYHFVKWSDNSTENPRTDSNVTANISVTASFAIDTFSLTYTPSANGSITGDRNQTVAYGADGTAVTAVPTTGYHFVSWSDGKTANPRTDSNVTANISVSASFAIDTFSLTYTAGAHGTIQGTSPQTVAYGANGTAVTAVPATGYHFVSWSDGKTANPRTDSNVTADLSVSASFAIDTFSLTYTAGAHGTIQGTSPQTVAYGANGSAVTAVPATGYQFVKWSDNVTTASRTDSNVTADLSVSASFGDATPPVTTQTGADSAWHNGAVAVTLSATDTGSGVATTEYSIDGSPWQTGTVVTLDTQGDHTLGYRSTDNAGNVEATTTVHIKIDLTVPTTTQSGATGNWQKGPVTVTFRATDAGGSGVGTTQYRIDLGGWQTATSVMMSADGDHTIDYRSTDAAGNAEPPNTMHVKVDATAPVTTQTGADDVWHTDWVTVTLKATDGASGVAYTEYRADDESTWTRGDSVSFMPLETRVTHTLYYRSVDNTDNVESTQTSSVKTEGVPAGSLAPNTTASSTTSKWNSAWQNEAVVVTLTAEDPSGVAFTEHAVDGGAWNRGTEVTIPAPRDHSNDGRHTLTYRSEDTRGMREDAKTAKIAIDTTPPATTATGGGTGWHNHDVTVRLTATDLRSGVAKSQYTLDGGKTWVQNSWLLVAALRNHSNDGLNAVGFRSTDFAGNVETTKAKDVHIDTRQPTTLAPYRTSVRRNRYVTLRYSVKDLKPTCGKATVTIRIKTLGGRTVKTLKPGLRGVNTSQRYRFRCGLARSMYHFWVYATDQAGNKQLIVGVNRLRVY